MRNIKITIEYDGTGYCGWQVQKNGLSIQEVMQRAIEGLSGEKINLSGSSRTDAGVHARGMVANFLTNSTIPTKNFPAAINSVLPNDIAVINAEEVPNCFHSRYDSTGKRYSYTILNREFPSALLRNYVAFIHDILDIEKMNEACAYFIGSHDFSAFKSSGGSQKTHVRTITLLQLAKKGDMIKIQIQADGFLYNMVRIIAGTLIDVGRMKINPEDISDIIKSKDRKRAGKTAPPGGLVLEEVFYNNDN